MGVRIFPGHSAWPAALVAMALPASAPPALRTGDGPDPCGSGSLVAVAQLRDCDTGVPALYPIAKPRSLDLARNVRSARDYAATRGDVSFAVIDSRGRLRGERMNQPHTAASLVKAMLLVAFLESARGELPPSDRALLDQMIRVSDNDAATEIFGSVGQAGLEGLARRAGLEDFEASPRWGDSKLTAADQARFFRDLDRLVPARHRAYARELLRTIVPEQSWGIPEVARPRWVVLFKGGWREIASGEIVNQAARLERDGEGVSVAVLSGGNPSMAYGIETVTEITSRLLRE